MLQYIIKRIISLAVILFGVSILVFMLMQITPGDPVSLMLGEDATQAEIDNLNRIYGFDQSPPVQYWRWISLAVQGDLGMSVRQNIPVSSLIWERMPATFELTIWSLVIAIGIGVPLGVLAAVRRNSWFDIGSMSLALVGVAAPNFWVGLLLLSQLALHITWLPVGGRGPGFGESMAALFTQFDFSLLWHHFRHALLPALALGTSILAVIMRLTRSSLLETLNADYVRTARAKGTLGLSVVYKHALRNALLPVITVVGVQFGSLLGGAIVIESVFSWPGVGRLILNGISQRDFPVVQGSVLLFSAIFAIVNLLVDLSYGLIDPRIRYA